MTPQEAQMLQDLVRKIQQTALTEKDPDAEALLMDGFARDPDALYKLAQTVLVQNLALNQAHMQIEQLHQQAVPPEPAPARATTFLGGLLGRHEPVVPPPSALPPQPYQAAPPPYSEPAPSGAGSFLRSAATTAAGVAAGALAFQGVESLLHGFGHSSGIGSFGGLGTPGVGAPAEETVINNYYDGSADQFDRHQEHEAASSDLQSQGQSDNDSGLLENASFDRNSDSSSDLETGYDDQDDQQQDDQQLDDSGLDDGGGDNLV